MLDLFEYYKFRRYVPVFVRATDSKSVVDSIYCYYYERLKLYYNGIKRNLNMTVDPSSRSDDSESDGVSISERGSECSQVLGDLTTKLSKENIRQYESESKALESLVTILKQN